MKSKYFAYMSVAALTLHACDDFLDRPVEDNYTVETFYKTDAQLLQAVNTLYNSPWYDFQRGFFKTGEVMSGNFYWGQSPYLTLTVNSTDEDLVNMSASLWSVNAYANEAIKNIDNLAGPACSQEGINTAKGEALTWKAMAYFYLVRSFGGVPIIHDNMALISSNDYNNARRAKPENVYDYIILTLNKAIEWLPESNATGRLDRYSAKGLLAKVYLTKAGISGSLNTDDLKKAVELAKDVKDNSGRELEANYSDIFRLANNNTPEGLISWRWTAEGSNWTRQNTLQSDLAPTGFSEYGDCWGGYVGPSVDLIHAFGEDALSSMRVGDIDKRSKATLMMPGDAYSYFWTDRSKTFDKGGFEILDFFYQDDAAKLAARGGLSGGGTYQSPTGANEVKHLVGDDADHVAGIGYSMQRMCTSLSTHILRLADVYLVLAEAQALIDGGTTSDADAIDAFMQVHNRSCTWKDYTSISWEEIWKERRLELACEGDRWYDFVRLAYYKPERAISELKAQERGSYYGLDEAYKTFFTSGYSTWDVSKCGYSEGATLNLTKDNFTLPFPDTDLTMNPGLTDEPIDVDVNQYTY